MAATYVLDSFQDDVVFACFACLDHLSNCRLQISSRTCKRIGRSPYLWRLQFEAARGLRGVLEETGTRDWLGEFKRLKPSWDDVVLSDHGRLEMLLGEMGAPPNCGGQDPRVFCLGAGQLLLLAGATYGERAGGADLRQASGAYLMDVSAAEGSISWRSVEVSGRPHSVLHGSYCGSFGDGVVADKIICFAGGSRTTLHNETSLLEIGGLANADTVRWSQLATFGREQPCPRYAGFGCVWSSSLLVLAGRTASRFFDELWLLDLNSHEWVRPELTGQGPSPRVWLRGARCGDMLLVYGGAEWRFDLSCWGNDTPGTIWALHVRESRWERLELSNAGMRPPLRVCPAAALCGRHLLIFGGVDLPTQEYLDDAWLFNTLTREWTEIELDCEKHGKCWFRSHVTAIFSRERRSCLLFGGGRYFEGVYFQEIAQISPQMQVEASTKLQRWYRALQLENEVSTANA